MTRELPAVTIDAPELANKLWVSYVGVGSMRVKMIFRTNKYLGNQLLSLTANETFHNKSHSYFDTQPQIFFPICFREKIQMKK